MSSEDNFYGLNIAYEDLLLYFAIAFSSVVVVAAIILLVLVCEAEKRLQKIKEQREIEKGEDEDYVKRFGLPLPPREERSHSMANVYWRDNWSIADEDPFQSRASADFIINDVQRMVPLPRATAPSREELGQEIGFDNIRYSIDDSTLPKKKNDTSQL
ncbi:uncharacterized protein LOC116616325 [Nematostella vectensis]|uniref:uncharacterized protein LOC116616325 n=1 Tax=Nematostella vectensis TaxID=45351 RepID=UPI00138F9D83|nr:uncharacterized protein LOC116616325 [Nematostella vectensis]XP_032234303.1 uncharacterized protein LOC116616325 [Nematostella vectensis]